MFSRMILLLLSVLFLTGCKAAPSTLSVSVRAHQGDLVALGIDVDVKR